MFVECSILLLVHRGTMLYVCDVSIPSSIVNVLSIFAAGKPKELNLLFDKMHLQWIFKIQQKQLLRIL